MSISLRPITQDNFEHFIDLEVHEHQRLYLASNVFSIAEASFFPHYTTRGIFADEIPVGFLMYVAALPEEASKHGEYYIWRFMLDKQFQGQGYGRAALQLLLEELRAKEDARKIIISYAPDNLVAKHFYASLGFVETVVGEDGEMEAVLDLFL